MSDMVGGGDSAKGSMQHRWKLYASVQPYLLRFVPADVRSYSAFLFHLVLHVISSLTLLLLSPFLYLIERYHAHRITLPLPYRHILITGASSGVGEGLAYHLASSSTRLVLVARNTEQLHLVADKCRAKGADVVEAVQDVEDQAGMERVIADAEAVRALDVVFAVAGREATMGGEEDIVSASRSVVSTNVLGALNTILPCVPYMRARRRGQLVFFSSQLGFLAAPLATDYDSAKVCIRLYGEGLRTLLHSSNIAVNVIVPGGMITPMMNALTARSQLPTVPFILPVPNAILFIMEGLQRNMGVIAYPSVMTAFNSAVGGWPAQVRDVLLYAMTTTHHIQWRLGEVKEYKDRGAGKGKAEDTYVKERQAETNRQAHQPESRKEL